MMGKKSRIGNLELQVKKTKWNYVKQWKILSQFISFVHPHVIM